MAGGKKHLDVSQRVLTRAWGAGQPGEGAWAYTCVCTVCMGVQRTGCPFRSPPLAAGPAPRTSAPLDTGGFASLG